MPSRPALLALGGVAVLLTAYVVASPSPEPPAAAPVAEAAAPSAANVDPGFHGRLMALKAEAEAAPDDLAAQLAFARFAAGAHRGAEAADALERAVALAPDDRQPWLDLANAYGMAEAWDDVADASERMLARFPDDAEARYNLGAAHANAGRADAAEAAWAPLAASDDPLAAQAQASVARLASLPPPSAAPPSAAPPIAPGAALPAGHPPLPTGHPPISATGACTSGTCADGGACDGDCAGGCGCDGVETRVVRGGTADARATRSLVTALAGQ